MASEAYVPPPVMEKQPYQLAKRDPEQNISDVVFDLETTGVDYLLDKILSIAAVTIDGKKLFEEYILPEDDRKISERSTQLTGLEIKKVDGEEILHLYDKPVKTVSLKTAMENFIDQLKIYAKGGKINLIAHNCLNLDTLILCQALTSCNLHEEFASVVLSITDSHLVFQKEFPDLKPYEYKLTELARRLDVLPKGFLGHNALDDAALLSKVLLTLTKTDSVDSCTFLWSTVAPRVEYLNRRSELFESLWPLVDAKVASFHMAKFKIAGSGIGFNDLQDAFLQCGKDGITQLLSAKTTDGKPRVTAHEPTIERFCRYFSSKEDCNSSENRRHFQTHSGVIAKATNHTRVVTRSRSSVVQHSTPPRSRPVQNSQRSKKHSDEKLKTSDTTEVVATNSSSDEITSTPDHDLKDGDIGDLIHSLKLELIKTKERLHDLELEVHANGEDFAQHRCVNLVRIFGVPEESREAIEDVVLDILCNDMKVSCSANDIDRCHRVGRYQSAFYRPIIVQFGTYRMKWQVLNHKNNLKGTKIIVCEELTEERLKLYYAVRAKVGQRNAWTNDGRIFARNRDGKVCVIQSMDDLSWF